MGPVLCGQLATPSSPFHFTRTLSPGMALTTSDAFAAFLPQLTSGLVAPLIGSPEVTRRMGEAIDLALGILPLKDLEPIVIFVTIPCAETDAASKTREKKDFIMKVARYRTATV